jgi:hypothetical protein
MRWIVVFVLLVCFGCGPSVPKSPPLYNPGDVVYHRLDGKKLIIMQEAWESWRVRYVDDMGQYHWVDFEEEELSSEPLE